MKALVLLSATLAFAASARAQQNFDAVQIKATPVAGNVHMLEGSGGNIGVSVGPDGVLIVDDQFLPLAGKIDAALQKLHPGPLRFVLNTHWHGDHTGGNPHFGKKATIVAQENVRKRLAAATSTPKEALPVVTFVETVSVHFNGEEIKVTRLQPGHTDGDSLIHFTKSGVVHTGDQFLNHRFPFIDVASGGDLQGYAKNIEFMLKNVPKDAKIIPGHGALATYADLEATHAMLNETIALVKKAIADGKTQEQIRAAGVPEKYKDWGAGFINVNRYLDAVFNALK
jgi:glyoxylase-like metal-dependent hydrolase (beta-lactamase superfamily II)